jgi:hypothetical protein
MTSPLMELTVEETRFTVRNCYSRAGCVENNTASYSIKSVRMHFSVVRKSFFTQNLSKDSEKIQNYGMLV